MKLVLKLNAFGSRFVVLAVEIEPLCDRAGNIRVLEPPLPGDELYHWQLFTLLAKGWRVLIEQL